MNLPRHADTEQAADVHKFLVAQASRLFDSTWKEQLEPRTTRTMRKRNENRETLGSPGGWVCTAAELGWTFGGAKAEVVKVEASRAKW